MFEAVVLAGGLGKRLRDTIGEYPKPMANIRGKPFLWYLFSFISGEGVKRVIISVGYKKEIIIDYFGNKFKEMELIYSLEEFPLGTGGALKRALEYATQENIFVFNGDTLFRINLCELYYFHLHKQSDITISLKYMENIFRYGFVELDEDGSIRKFLEKGKFTKGYINGGIYIVNVPKLWEIMGNIEEETFSFERDVIEKNLNKIRVFGKAFDDYFIDIGIREDYERAKFEIVEL